MVLDKNWPSLVKEEILEPELPICDSHHHFWINRDGPVHRDLRYLLDELMADINNGHNIVSTVFVETRSVYRPDGPEALKPVGETEFANGIALMSATGLLGKTRVAAAIVGHADFRLGDAVEKVLDAHIAAGGGRFRGIRQSGGWDASDLIRNSPNVTGPGFYLNEQFRKGFRHLAPRNLTFDAWCYHTQLPDLADLAHAFPDTTIILNHFGGPLGIGPYNRDETFDVWKKSIAELAACPNAMVKMGGLYMDIIGFRYHERPQPPSSDEVAKTTRRFYDHTISVFGADRCMFGSNFPVEKQSMSYNTLWNVFKRVTAGYSPTERAKFFHDTASKAYRINL